MEWVWAAYEELATCRTSGMTVGQIPWTAVRMYADRYGLSLEEEEELLVYVRAIDAALITNDE